MAPFPLKEFEEALDEDEDEVPLEERLEPDKGVVTVTPNALVDVLPAGVVTEPDVEIEDVVEVEVELVVVTVAPIEKSPLVPKTELMLLISTASIV